MDFTRQEELFDPAQYGGIPITLIGAGSIGSFSGLFLAKVGFRDITVYDDDIVEEHNIPNQLYSPSSIGTLKVMALHDIILGLTGTSINSIAGKFTAQQLKGIVISAVDSMRARRNIFKKSMATSGILAFIDPRMGGWDYRVYTIRPGQEKAYSWYPDSETVREGCSGRSVIFTVACVASLVTTVTCSVAMKMHCPTEILGEAKTISLVTPETRGNL